MWAYLHCAVVRVEQEFGEGGDLGRAVPAVRTVHEHGPLVPVHSVHHQQRRLQQQRQVLQPLGALQSRQPTRRKKETEECVGVKEREGRGCMRESERERQRQRICVRE